MAHTLKILPAMPETQVPSLGWQGPLEEEMTTHSTVLAWRIPWTEEPGGLHTPWGCQRVGHADQLTHEYNFIYLLIFGCARSSLLRGRFSSCREQGPLSSCGLWTSQLRWILSFAECRLEGAWASAGTAHGCSCSTAHGIFLKQGSNLCPCHWRSVPCVSCVGRRIVYHWAIREALWVPVLIRGHPASGFLSCPMLSSWVFHGNLD